MIKVYSKIDPTLLLHIIVRPNDFNKTFLDITDPDSFLQSLAIRLNEGESRKAHKHLVMNDNVGERTQQEAWVVLNGIIKCNLYDTDGSFLSSHVIQEKSTLITLYGAHGLDVLEDHTFILEFKLGPYKGNINDKTYI